MIHLLAAVAVAAAAPAAAAAELVSSCASAAAAAAASETRCLKSPSDWSPSSHPYQAIALIFHRGPCCFSLELSVFSGL